MQKHEIRTIQELPDDCIYYNLSLYNNTTEFIPANYSENLQYPILKNPNDYFLSIVRFSLPTQSVPIFTFKDNFYYVALNYLGNNYNAPLVYVNTDLLFPNGRDIYSYTAMIDLINTALTTVYNAMISANPALIGLGLTDAPYMTFDSNNFECSLYCMQLYETLNIGIYMNNYLYYLFDNFFSIREGDGLLNKQDFKIVVKNLKNNIPASPANYYKNTQEYSSIFSWSDVIGINFTSSLLPVNSEYIPSNNNLEQKGLVSSLQVLTDFEAVQNIGDPSGFRGIQQYQATKYRLVNMTSNFPLRTVDLQITYKKKDGTTRPLFIPQGSILTVKIAFLKKDLYKSYGKDIYKYI